MIEKDLEKIRKDLISLIEKVGSDYQAAMIISQFCSGFGPDRSTLGKFRRGEGKPSIVAMATALLRLGIEKKLVIDRVGEPPYTVDIEIMDYSRRLGMFSVSEDAFYLALKYKGFDISTLKNHIEKKVDESAYNVAEEALSSYIAESRLVFEDQPDLEEKAHFLGEDMAQILFVGTMHGERDPDANHMVTHHDVNPKVELRLNIAYDDMINPIIEFEN